MLTSLPQGGWVTFPTQTYAYDPASAVKLPDGSGPQGMANDLALHRWVGVPREWIAPDGLRYAFVGGNGTQVVLVLKDGSMHAYPMPAGAVGGADRQFGGTLGPIVSAENEGVYVRTDPGLALVHWDGTLQWITHAGYWQTVGGGSAYGSAEAMSTRSEDWGPGQWGETLPVQRLNLTTGAVTNFFARDRMKAKVMGFGATGPVVETTDGKTMEVWMVGATAVRILSSTLPGVAHLVTSVMADSHGTWLFLLDGPSPLGVGGSGVWLYTPQMGLQRAYDLSPLGAWFASSCR